MLDYFTAQVVHNVHDPLCQVFVCKTKVKHFVGDFDKVVSLKANKFCHESNDLCLHIIGIFHKREQVLD
mgnify:CR=1 FL=1